MGGDGGEIIAYRVLADRCRSLEEKQAKLREQFDELVHEKKLSLRDDDEVIADSTKGFLSRFFFSGSPYASVLKCMGHAVYVHRVPSGEIIYWNHSAETLYGWKDYEIIGKRAAKLLIPEEYYASQQKILERLISRVPWSGQFPLKKRSGEIFMAMVTKTPLYEDGELVGVITVSSDAAIFTSLDSENRRTYQFGGNGQAGAQRSNIKRIQWPPQPIIAPMPQITSSVSNLVSISFVVTFSFVLYSFFARFYLGFIRFAEIILYSLVLYICQASKFLPLRHTEDTLSRNTSTDTDDGKLEKSSIYETKPHSRHQHAEDTTVREASEKDESTTDNFRPSKIAARVLAKLQIGGSGNFGKDNGSIKNNSAADYSGSNRVNNVNDPSRDLVALTLQQDVANGVDKEKNLHRCN